MQNEKISSERDLLETLLSASLVARDDVVAELKKCFASVSEGKNIFVLIEGEIGTGKTRLLKELSKTFPSAKAFYTIGLEAESTIPYRLLINILREYCNSLSLTELEKIKKKLPYFYQAQLARILPELSIKNQDTLVQTDDTEKRKLLFEGIANLLIVISEQQPLLILLDELHNVDEGTLEIINYLLQAEYGRIMFVGTLRTSIFNVIEKEYPILDNFLSIISATGNFRHIALENFSLSNTTRFISALLPGRIEIPTFDQKLHSITSGNPLFIEETIKNFILKKFIIKQDTQWVINEIPADNWPSSLDSVIQDNFNLLDKSAAELVTNAVVGGVKIDIKVLKELLNKNEDEILELLGIVKRMGLLEEVQPGRPDQVRFSNQRIQEIIYQQLDEKTRQDLHHQIAQAIVKIYQDNLDEFAAVISYHYRLAEDLAQAAQYTQLAEATSEIFRHDETGQYYEHDKMIVRSMIKEAVEPLEANVMKLMRDVLRGLCATAKNIRLYPEGNELIIQSISYLMKSLETVLAQTEKVTISEVKDTLYINTVPVDPKTFGISVGEFAELLKKHFIKSCTFLRGVSEKEIKTFLADLNYSPNKEYSFPGYWNKFLEENYITNIGITQKAFVVRTGKVTSKLGLQGELEKLEFTPQTIPIVRDFLRYFIAALENFRIYPQESQLTIQALEQLYKNMNSIFNNVNMIELSKIEDVLLFNGIPLNPRIFGASVQSMVELLSNIKSITIAPSCTKEELVKLIKLINHPPAGAETNLALWNSALSEMGVVNIVLGEAIYTMIADIKNGWRPRDIQPNKVELALLVRTEQLLKSLPDKLVSPEFIEVAEKLVQANFLKQLQKLIDRFVENFKSSRVEIRLRALRFFITSFDKVSSSVKEYMVKQITPVLTELLKSEKEPTMQPILLDATQKTLNFYLAKKDYDNAANLVSLLGKESKDLTHLTNEIKEKRIEILTKMIQAENFSAVLDDLSNPDPQIQSGAIVLLASFGHLVLPTLIEIIKNNDNFAIREITATIIRQIGPEAVSIFVNDLKQENNPRRLQNMLSVLAVIDPPEMHLLLGNYFKHSEDKIREETLNIIKKLPKKDALVILSQALRDQQEKTVLLAAETLAELGYQEVVNDIIALFERIQDIEKLCRILGKLGNTKAIPLLTNVLFKKSFLGLRCSYPDKVRGAAAWALGQFNTPAVTAILEKALNDKSPEVRSVVKLRLKK